MMYNSSLSVFLSHSHKDIDKVRKIRDILETININPIMFYLKCLDDDNCVLEDFIKKEIEARNIFIYCKSDNAEKSVWVQKELEYIRQIDINRLYVIDIENDFEHSLVETLQTLSQLIRRNTIILCYYKDDEVEISARSIADALMKKGYIVEDVHSPVCAPPPYKPSWNEFLYYKDVYAGLIERDIEPIVKDVGKRGIFVPLLSKHYFEIDEQWARMILSKIMSLGERHECTCVPIHYSSNLTKEKLNEIVNHIYLKTIEI